MFTYELQGRGWARAEISDSHGQSAVLNPSYLTDALGDLLGAVSRLLDGARRAECAWASEPGGPTWAFVLEADAVHLQIINFGDDDDPDEGALVFETRVAPQDLARAIAAGAQDVLNRYGVENYLTRWVEHPFPASTLKRVQQQLAGRA